MAHWIAENKRNRSVIFICSECKERVYDYRHGQKLIKECGYKYCPHCGIKMNLERNVNNG